MTDRRPRAITRSTIAGLAASLLLLAACSGGGAAPTAPSGGSPATGNTAASSAAACGNPAGGLVGSAGGAYASVVGGVLCRMSDIDPCSMLKLDDVQALFAVPLASSTTDHLGNCSWHLSDPSKGDGLDVVVNVDSGGVAALNDDINLAQATPLSGVGDKAGWELLGGYFPHLGAVKGQDTCELTIGGGNGQLSVHTTGKDVFAKIDATALPGFIQKFGALCNQVFAGLGA